MEWLHMLLADHPAGHFALAVRHNPYLIFLAYLVMCAGSFATLDIIERIGDSEHAAARRRWKILGACCLACSVWAMHYIGMLAFETTLEVHYDMFLTGVSLLIMLSAALCAMNILGQPLPRTRHYALAALCVAAGVAIMHYTGMAAMRSNALQHYNPALVLVSVIVALIAALLPLLMARYLRGGNSSRPQLFKYGAAVVMAGGIIATHYTGMCALSLTLPDGTSTQMALSDNSLQLSLTIAVITLLISGSCISAALSDKKLQSKEQDLQRVNTLLTQLDQARVSLQQAAHYDALTNLINRRGFNQIFAERLAEQSQIGGMLGVMFLDIDHFKRINDSLGHDAGDQLLKAIANLIKAATRNQDVVARLGGDEFCILFNLKSPDEARGLAQRILQKVREPIDLAGRRMVMTTSIGISLFPDDGGSCDELLKHADLALYQSKGSGRNKLNFFSDNLKTRATLELQLEEELRIALLEERGLRIHYQPIYELASGRVTKLEALIRWQHPQHGLLSPDRFIGIAETNGLIADLDLWVMRRACLDLAELSQHGFGDLKVTVNCSALTLGRDELANEVQEALLGAGLPAWRLELEVTENALMANIHSTIALLRRIREQGVSLSIDDFGTGYSSLAYLKRLPLDTLKIDRSFIQDVPRSRADKDIVQAIMVMAHTLHLKVITEGVETEEQYEFLRQLECDAIQGYLLSRPVPLEALRDVLNELNHREERLMACCDTDQSASRDLFPDSPERHAGASTARPVR
ncbi:bifunctional diguanylate cyclase/phosphodiesterase [Pseudomonas sp. Marseille-P9899]|uniref:bifunctional diguanylate cyclase/phosphodiesterase n=1 Tax=Pseudomonas sp. Marseille-P9899 TaxID=2730401 RepID=UPI00158EC967|nr:EAL domain-containing protein [Pseudomonas sp. Marseille-P9899]